MATEPIARRLPRRLAARMAAVMADGVARRLRCAGRALALALLGLSLFPLGAHAWGFEAHRLVAEAAAERLSAPARERLQRLLDQEPGATPAALSTWADEVRSPATAAWHYVNLPREAGCRYEAARDCPDGQCVVAAIERQARLLAKASGGDAQRLKALKYLLHLVADVHQPLHAAFGDDRGGNRYQVRVAGRGSHLHAVWDVDVVQRYPGGLAALREAVHEALRRQATAGDGGVAPVRAERVEGAEGAEGADAAPLQWAEESCRIAAAPGFYPERRQIDEAYLQRAAPLVRDRLAQAARRLARMLESALMAPGPAPM